MLLFCLKQLQGIVDCLMGGDMLFFLLKLFLLKVMCTCAFTTSTVQDSEQQYMYMYNNNYYCYTNIEL